MRINGTDSAEDAVVKLVDGNPGAVVVVTGLLKISMSKEYPVVGHIGKLWPLVALDVLEIYGERIYELFKVECDKDIDKTYAVLEDKFGIHP